MSLNSTTVGASPTGSSSSRWNDPPPRAMSGSTRSSRRVVTSSSFRSVEAPCVGWARRRSSHACPLADAGCLPSDMISCPPTDTARPPADMAQTPHRPGGWSRALVAFFPPSCTRGFGAPPSSRALFKAALIIRSGSGAMRRSRLPVSRQPVDEITAWRRSSIRIACSSGTFDPVCGALD